ncbi:MAG: AtzE family amidohydrolase [Rhizobiales bacterium]|nr:AtzE family amidohydrolase [Hyphomicrobiales bacterium]
MTIEAVEMTMCPNAFEIAEQVRNRARTAISVTEEALHAIAAKNGKINAFTTITAERARKRAREIDKLIASGKDPGALAGVPFAAKDLFDIEAVVTKAGSKILASNPPAEQDAAAILALEQAGAVLVGALNMEEFAYGFLTDNAHYGPTRNPLDLQRTAGGSSGGTAAAVASGMVPLALGTDTNGSIRVPASFCGVVGMKPTFGCVDRTGMVPLAPSQDHVGWIGNCVEDVALAWRVLGRGAERAEKQAAPVVAVAGGYFAERMTEDVRKAMATAREHLDVRRTVEIPCPDVARAASYAITSSEASALRLGDLRDRPEQLDPSTRYRFLAGALLPAAWYIKGKRFQAWFRTQMEHLFKDVDVLLLPASPFVAPRFGDESTEIEGASYPVRPTIGRFTQPISSAGLPIVCLPVPGASRLPIGVQLVGPPNREDLVLAAALKLERSLAKSRPGE